MENIYKTKYIICIYNLSETVIFGIQFFHYMDSIKSDIYVENLAEFVFMIQKGILLETVLMGTHIK